MIVMPTLLILKTFRKILDVMLVVLSEVEVGVVEVVIGIIRIGTKLEVLLEVIGGLMVAHVVIVEVKMVEIGIVMVHEVVDVIVVEAVVLRTVVEDVVDLPLLVGMIVMVLLGVLDFLLLVETVSEVTTLVGMFEVEKKNLLVQIAVLIEMTIVDVLAVIKLQLVGIVKVLMYCGIVQPPLPKKFRQF